MNLDDDLYVYENPAVSTGLSMQGLRYAFTTIDGGSWMPLTWTSLLLDGTLWGTAPGGYHATNIILHALSAGLLCLVFFRMTGQLWPSVVVAAWFAIHPLRVESVIWISERKDVLSGLFFTLTLLAYARHVARPGPARITVATGCLVLGLMAKPMLVTVPVLLLLLDVWPLRRLAGNAASLKHRLRPLILEKLPMLLACAVFGVLTLRTQAAVGAMLSDVDPGFERVARIAHNYAFYLAKLFWPRGLNVLYPTAPMSLAGTTWAVGLILALSLIALGLARRRPWLVVGWVWFLVALFPVSGVVPVGPTWVADRYTYLPSVGIAVMLAWTGWSLASAGRLAWGLASGIAGLIVGLLAALTLLNLPRWQDSRTLFTDAVKKGGHPGAHLNLGVALANQGHLASAIEHYSQAIELNPSLAEAYYNRANAFQALQEPERALADFTRAIDLKPNYPAAYNNRGNLRAAKGQFDLAIQDFTQAIVLRPHYLEALVNRAHAYLALGRYQEAVADYSAAIASRPAFAAAYHDRAVAYYQLKEFARAWADLRTCRALGMNPNPELVRQLEAESERRN